MNKLTIDKVNKRRPRCRQCSCPADMIWVEDKDERLHLLMLRREKGTMEFLCRLREVANCGLAEAKATCLHLALPDRRCHKCNSGLSEGTIVDCESCDSVNLIWDDDQEI
jgi:hypothetical protein